MIARPKCMKAAWISGRRSQRRRGDGRSAAKANLRSTTRRSLPTPEPCRLVALTYGGSRALVAGVFGGVHGLDADGKILWEHRTDQPVVGAGLAPQGDWAVIALADGRIIGLDVTS